MACAVRAISPNWRIEIVEPSKLHRFAVMPERRSAERTFVWLGRCRRLASDFESRARNARAFLLSAAVRIMVRKLRNRQLWSWTDSEEDPPVV